MGEFGLNDLWKRLEEQISLLKEDMSATASCWRCNKGKNKGKLISPCKCIKQFIHVHCLEISANTWEGRRCQFCRTQYPLEIRHKPLLKCYRDGTLLQMFREIHALLFKILLLMFFYLFFISTIVYVIISFNYIIRGHIIFIVTFMIILYLCTLFFFIYMTEPTMINWSNRIHEIYRKSTQEIKLKKQYPNI